MPLRMNASTESYSKIIEIWISNESYCSRGADLRLLLVKETEEASRQKKIMINVKGFHQQEADHT